MKGYFIFFEDKNQYGVRKKIAGQIRALQVFSEVDEINVPLKNESFTLKLKSRFPFWGYGYNYEQVLNKIQNPDYIYIRHTLVDQDYIGFFRNLKKKYPDVKIICELYTYPYDKDFYWRKTTWPLYIKERMYRDKLKNYIDRFVTLTDDDSIFSIKTIKTVNGIDLDMIPFVEPIKRNDDELHLISVAVMQKHHGFERLIKGLYLYYSNGGRRRIVYTVVGNSVGGEVEKYKALVEKYSLGNVVHFVGSKKGAELDALLREADIGVCSLGAYKLGIEASSQLKSREYLAMGIPMLTGCKIDVFEGSDFEYYVDFPNDPSPIGMNKVLGFYDRKILNSGKSKSEIAHEIRSFAEKNVDIERMMKPIQDYVLSE